MGMFTENARNRQTFLTKVLKEGPKEKPETIPIDEQQVENALGMIEQVIKKSSRVSKITSDLRSIQGVADDVLQKYGLSSASLLLKKCAHSSCHD